MLESIRIFGPDCCRGTGAGGRVVRDPGGGSGQALEPNIGAALCEIDMSWEQSRLARELSFSGCIRLLSLPPIHTSTERIALRLGQHSACAVSRTMLRPVLLHQGAACCAPCTIIYNHCHQILNCSSYGRCDIVKVWYTESRPAGPMSRCAGLLLPRATARSAGRPVGAPARRNSHWRWCSWDDHAITELFDGTMIVLLWRIQYFGHRLHIDVEV